MQVKNIVTGQKYTTRDGQEKTKWTTIGAMFIKDDGKMSIKLEQIPLNWDGQAQVFEREQKQQGGCARLMRTSGLSSSLQTRKNTIATINNKIR